MRCYIFVTKSLTWAKVVTKNSEDKIGTDIQHVLTESEHTSLTIDLWAEHDYFVWKMHQMDAASGSVT